MSSMNTIYTGYNTLFVVAGLCGGTNTANTLFLKGKKFESINKQTNCRINITVMPFCCNLIFNLWTDNNVYFKTRSEFVADNL